jgi:hypothetical protein
MTGCTLVSGMQHSSCATSCACAGASTHYFIKTLMHFMHDHRSVLDNRQSQGSQPKEIAREGK